MEVYVRRKTEVAGRALFASLDEVDRTSNTSGHALLGASIKEVLSLCYLNVVTIKM